MVHKPDIILHLKDVVLDLVTSQSASLSLTLHEGEWAVISGDSGIGKSSLIETIIGMRPPLSGIIHTQDPIAWVPQQAEFVPQKNAWKNICLTAKDKSYARELFEKFDMIDTLEKYPMTLSGGERQRLSLIRALATLPKLLLLDEATNALDDTMAERVLTHIHDDVSTKKMACLAMSHQALKLRHDEFKYYQLSRTGLCALSPQKQPFK